MHELRNYERMLVKVGAVAEEGGQVPEERVRVREGPKRVRWMSSLREPARGGAD
jgi:hypothetical protein